MREKKLRWIVEPPTDCEYIIHQVIAFFHSLDIVYNTVFLSLTLIIMEALHLSQKK
jgi:hypothetical protein